MTNPPMTNGISGKRKNNVTSGKLPSHIIAHDLHTSHMIHTHEEDIWRVTYLWRWSVPGRVEKHTHIHAQEYPEATLVAGMGTSLAAVFGPETR